MNLHLVETYAPRRIRMLGVEAIEGWRVKVHGIAYRRSTPRAELVDAAVALTARVLPRPAVTDSRYGVGFTGVHDGRGSCFVFVDWWEDENELHHRVFVAPADSPTRLEDRTGTGLAACVWDLVVLGHERDAWVQTVLANPDGPDLDAYLARTIDTEV